MSSIVHSLVRINKLGLNEYLSLKNNFGEARQELKFLVPRNLMPEIIDFLSGNFDLCLSGNNQMTHSYLSKYFDTDDLMFFNMHRQGKYNRMKVRVREYRNGETRSFLECKRKIKGFYTIKDRAQLHVDTVHFSDDRIQSRLEEYQVNSENLKEKARIAYNRLIFVAKDQHSRVTVDFGIDAENSDGTRAALLPNHCILEVKSEEKPKEILAFLKTLGLRPEAFSKYCVALCMLRDDVRKNKWKQVLKLC